MDSSEPATSTTPDQPRQYTVWSDLRAMRLLAELQKDVQQLQAAQARWQFLVMVGLVVLAGGLVAIASVLTLAYSDIQNLKSPASEPQSALSSESYDG
ncbi:hypothetical protein [Spirulina major]|uniref:hypothetical protein n=1 Tax=Spirulina major TaxID=270636 RepID=UPI000934FD52|nr:hypothetical protein [Spirulina major]